MTKLYVKETTKQTHDGDYLVTVRVYKSEPDKYSYLIWIGK